MKEIDFKISQFIDNELSDAEQKELFAVLSENKDARQTLAEFLRMKKDTSKHYIEITADLLPMPSDLLVTMNKKRQPNIYRFMFYFTAAAAVILLMLLTWNQNGKEDYSSDYRTLKTNYESLQKNYENSLKQLKDLRIKQTVTSTTKSNTKKRELKHELIFTSNTGPIRKPFNSLNEKYLANLPKFTPITISKEDFIGGQIVGN